MMAGAYDRQIVYMARYIREKVRNFNTGLAKLFELPLRGEQRRVGGICELQPEILQARG
jgi:hypothetical protein